MASKKPSNPNAFPITGSAHPAFTGMTLRDHFAGLAMQGNMASHYGVNVHCTDEDLQAIAEQYYKIADAMLKQREL